MEKNNKFSIINRIINKNGGYITRKDIDENGIPSMYLSLYVKRNNLIKYYSGFYAREDWLQDDYFIFQCRYPKLVYSFYCAAFIHHLTDIIPSYIEVTGPKNYRPFPLPKDGVILHTDTRDATYNLGIITAETNLGNKIRIYDLEKTVCDFIANRKRIDSEAFTKCLHSYKRRKDKNLINLFAYAKIMNIENVVYDIMEIILNED